MGQVSLGDYSVPPFLLAFLGKQTGTSLDATLRDFHDTFEANPKLEQH